MSYSIYAAKYADADDPEPTLLTPDAMLAKLRESGVHPESPAGRGVLNGGKILADEAGRTFWTSPRAAKPKPSGLPTWAQPHAAPAELRHDAATAVGAGRDVGDDVADALDRQLGRSASSSAPRATATQHASSLPSAGRDFGDDIADALDRQLGRTGSKP